MRARSYRPPLGPPLAKEGRRRPRTAGCRRADTDKATATPTGSSLSARTWRTQQLCHTRASVRWLRGVQVLISRVAEIEASARDLHHFNPHKNGRPQMDTDPEKWIIISTPTKTEGRGRHEGSWLQSSKGPGDVIVLRLELNAVADWTCRRIGAPAGTDGLHTTLQPCQCRTWAKSCCTRVLEPRKDAVFADPSTSRGCARRRCSSQQRS